MESILFPALELYRVFSGVSLYRRVEERLVGGRGLQQQVLQHSGTLSCVAASPSSLVAGRGLRTESLCEDHFQRLRDEIRE